MEIYLAGGMTGNLSALWKELARNGGGYNNDTNMQIYLTGEHPVKNEKLGNWKDINILETFYYLRDNKEFPRLATNMSNFLLDSGAFTFMSNNQGKVDFDGYVEEFAAFINKWSIP